MRPRWGGSYKEMSEYAQEAIKYVDLNPLLWTLQGEASADAADIQESKNDYQSAVKSYTQALMFGDYIPWLKKRATCYSKLGQTDLALTDANKILYYYPNDTVARAFLESSNPVSLKYNLSDDTYITPKINKLNIRTYAVLTVDIKVDWLNKRGQNQAYSVSSSNITKIERMLRRLGYVCTDRSKIVALIEDMGLSLVAVTNATAQQIGRMVNADAVIIAAISDMGINRQVNEYFEDIEIKAISAANGEIIWNSILKGSVDAGRTNANEHMQILDSIENKLYDHLGEKIMSETPQAKEVKRN